MTFYLIGVEKAWVTWMRQGSLQIAIVLTAVIKARVMVPKPTLGSQEPRVRVLTEERNLFMFSRLRHSS